MKKHITKIFAAVLVLCGLTACSDVGEAQPENQSSVTDSAPSDTESTSFDTESSSSDAESSYPESESNDSESEIKPKTVYVYGEAEIPDIPCGDVNFEGKASTMNDHDALEQGLDRMVFETHTFGDYTVKLVGDKVRTDKANFPNSIYVQGLGAEVRKNGEKIEEHSDTYYSA